MAPNVGEKGAALKVGEKGAALKVGERATAQLQKLLYSAASFLSTHANKINLI